MKTFDRVCIKDFIINHSEGILELKRGKIYKTSAVNDAPSIGPKPVKNHVIVFTTYWVPVPIEYFAGEIEN